MTTGDLPASGRRRRRPWHSGVWLVPLVSAVLVGWFVRREVFEKGPTIEVDFLQGEGLEAGRTDLRYHGVKVGEVKKLSLSEDLKRVVAQIELDKTAAPLAREGAQFWIVRPKVSAAGVSGLGTLISGSYIEVMPGRGPLRDAFRGLESPPAVAADERGLQIYLLSPRSAGVDEGAAVYYRGIRVGAAAESVLADDGRSVRTRVVIERPYRDLVRAGSQFWNAGGIKFKFSLFHGAQMSAKSLSSVIEGGVAFATPDPPGPLAQDDQTFALQSKPKDEWMKWAPAIKIGNQAPVAEDPAP